MAWRRDIENAPKGGTKELTLTHHRSKGSFTKTITVREQILLSVGNQVIPSFWSTTRNHWVGLATGQEPDAWQPWPEPFKPEGL